MFSRVSTLWKTAAGCAICASIVAGMFEDTRRWVFRSIGDLIISEASAFDSCLADHLAANDRPAAGVFHILLTVPRGDDAGKSQFFKIERTLVRLYGSEPDALIQVESLNCLPLQPDGGVISQAMATALERGRDVIARSGADVVIWGEVLTENQLLELRFIDATQQRSGEYVVEKIVLAPDFGEDVGALIAAKALTLAAVTPELEGHLLARRMALALEITAPLAADMPEALDARTRADINVAHGLALYYTGLETGRNDLLDQAIAAFAAAQPGISRATDPAGWAAVEIYSAIALSRRGERDADPARLLEAVSRFDAVLVGLDRAALPDHWALAQLHRADTLLALGLRETGTVRQELAIAGYRQALTHYRRETDPLNWAAVQTSLGNALQAVGGQTADAALLAEAQAALDGALQVFDVASHPLYWAVAQNNRGTTLFGLGDLAGDPVLLTTAIAAFTATLDVYHRDTTPLDWARAQFNIGKTHERLAVMEPGAGHRQMALLAFDAALLGYPRDSVPLDWAATQFARGNMLALLGADDADTARLEQAVAAYDQALLELTPDRDAAQSASLTGKQGATRLLIADRRKDAELVQQALVQMIAAEAALRGLGEIAHAAEFARIIPEARALLDRMASGFGEPLAP